MTRFILHGRLEPRGRYERQMSGDVHVFAASGLVMRGANCAWLGPAETRIVAALAVAAATGRVWLRTADLAEALTAGEADGGPDDPGGVAQKALQRAARQLAAVRLGIVFAGGHYRLAGAGAAADGIAA